MKSHTYKLDLQWTGNLGSGTSNYRAYTRDHDLTATGKPPIPGSSDPAFRGDAARWNPEELLVASLAQCHMLWYLHLATTAGVVVTGYRDAPLGTMHEQPDGSGQFARVVLRPTVTVTDPAMLDRAEAIHHDVGNYCFIARSVNFPVEHAPTILLAEAVES